jgi:hypothetical protein
MGMGDGRGWGLNAELAKITQRTRRRGGVQEKDFNAKIAKDAKLRTGDQVHIRDSLCLV